MHRTLPQCRSRQPSTELVSGSLAARFPDFPWDLLAPYADIARRHPGGVIDLSVGTPVDPTPAIAQSALAAAANAPGYPTTAGLPALRDACAAWLARVHGVTIEANAVLPCIGSKELVASLPLIRGLGPGDDVVVPRVAYPTYAVGAALVGATAVATDEPEVVPNARLIWLNSPGNPTGSVLSAERLAAIVTHARAAGTLVASDECYLDLGWTATPVSALAANVSGTEHTGVVSLFSLSKRSNMAGYRFGFLAGDADVIAELLAVRKHLGMMVPLPVQHAAIAALADDESVIVQRERYRARREVLATAITAAGLRIEDSHAGLYLWATRDEPCWQSVSWFAERGIVVTPGDFYGAGGTRHIRVALTCTDAQADEVGQRLSA